ncbi:MAG TPA: hypothetical protein VLW26_04250 [Steroidobacteraceae bacterium]|nr:hypothetical protein [Steroidobacteraceae bacterium]
MLPPGSITRLCDHFGQFVIDVRCRKCRHARQLTPEALAAILGWKFEIAKLADRLRCSQCHARAALIHIAFDRKPRGWNKNPS